MPFRSKEWHYGSNIFWLGFHSKFQKSSKSWRLLFKQIPLPEGYDFSISVELAMIMDRLYGGVCYAGIDTDPARLWPLRPRSGRPERCQIRQGSGRERIASSVSDLATFRPAGALPDHCQNLAGTGRSLVGTGRSLARALP